MRWLLGIWVLLLAAGVQAQGALKLSFPSAQPRQIWSAPDLSEIPTQTTATSESEAEVPPPLSDLVVVLDEASGSIAYKKTREIKGEWRLVPADYKLIAHVKVRVEYKGLPLKAASIRVNGSPPKLIDESSDGTATFDIVKAGSVQVEAVYRSGTRDRTQKQSFTLDINREDPVPTVVVSVPHEAQTLAAPKPKPTPAASPKPQQARPSILNSLLLFVGLLALAAAVLYFGLKLITKNQDKAKDFLNSVGVTVPDPISPDPGTAPPPVAAPDPAPGPQQPIILPAAAMPDPTPAPTPAPAPFSPPAAFTPGAFRLISAHGLPIEISEGTAVVGREAGLAVSLEGESTVSRRHAELVRSGGSVVVRDLGSTNGTFVNGSRISSETPLKPGDTVQFGAVRFRCE